MAPVRQMGSIGGGVATDREGFLPRRRQRGSMFAAVATTREGVGAVAWRQLGRVLWRCGGGKTMLDVGVLRQCKQYKQL